MKKFLVIIFAFPAVAATLGTTMRVAEAQAPAVDAAQSPSPQALGGIWVLNRQASQLPGPGNPPDGGDRRGGPGGPGGFGRGGFGGRGGGFPEGGDFPGRGGDPQQMQATMNYVRSIMNSSDRLTIVVHDASVGLTDAAGGTLTLQTDNKKLEERAENGLIKLTRRSRWNGPVLVSEIDIDSGPKLTRRYELSADGSELRILTTMSGGFGRSGGAANQPILHVYERPREP